MQERSKSPLLGMEGDIKGKTEKLDEPRRFAARLFFTAEKKFRPPHLYFVTARNGRSIKGGAQYWISAVDILLVLDSTLPKMCFFSFLVLPHTNFSFGLFTI